MDRRKEIVRDSYDRIAGRYLDWSAGSKVRTRYLAQLLALLPTNADVLELGCGAGLPVTKALAKISRVTAVDISPEQVRLAKQNTSTAEIVCADMMALEFPAIRFDAVVAFYAITHLPREEHGELFHRIAHWLKPGGYFFASLGASALDDRIELDWLGAPNFFSHYDADESLQLVTKAGLEIVEREVATQDLTGEEGLQFLWITARKPFISAQG